MSELMDVINAFGTPLKIAWVGWVAWGVGQYFWFRHERSAPVDPQVGRSGEARGEEAGRSQARRRAGGRSAGGGTTLHADARRRGREGEHRPVVAGRRRRCRCRLPSPLIAAPAFDPSTAVIETFGAATERRAGQVRQGFRNAGCASAPAEKPSDGDAFVRRRGAANPVAPRDHKTKGGSPRSRLCAPGSLTLRPTPNLLRSW